MNQRREELLADWAMGCLEERGSEELQALLGGVPSNAAEAAAFERAAASLDLAFARLDKNTAEPLPERLAARTLERVRDARTDLDLGIVDRRRQMAQGAAPAAQANRPRRSWAPLAGWVTAAAAAGLALYLSSALGSERERRSALELELAALSERAGAGSAVQAELRASLTESRNERDTLADSELGLLARVEQLELELAEALDRAAALEPASPQALEAELERLLRSGSLTFEWSAQADPLIADANVEGDVVWDPNSNSGLMRFKGLPVNEPTREQYQLWIFDSSLDEATPIDGGVFDIDDAGNALVRIDPKIRVTHATLFAVTLERPGGVVVSDRARLLLVAEAG